MKAKLKSVNLKKVKTRNSKNQMINLALELQLTNVVKEIFYFLIKNIVL
jgi:hypothetical protein